MRFHCSFLSLLALSRLSPCLGSGSGSGPTLCSRTDTFDAAVLVVHDGTSLDSITSAEKQTLGEAFAGAYNEVNHPSYANSPFCDATHYRHVKTVLVEPKDAYLTHEETSTHLARKNFIYKITGICDGSCGDNNLFDEVSTSRRRLGLFTAANPTGTCTCPGSTSANRGPTESDIMAKFQANIDAKVASNDLVYVKEVIEAVEVKPYSCSSATTEEDIDVIVDLNTEPDPADTGALEDGFLDAYNQLAKFYCDEDTTRVLNVTMLGEVNDTGHLIRGRRRLGKKKKKRRMFRTIQQQSESSGFDDGIRRLQETTISEVEVQTDTGSQVLRVTDEELHRMQSSGMKFQILSSETKRRELSATLDSTCYCPVRPIATRAMNETEFASSYNMTLAEEAATGALTTDYSVQNVQEESDSS